MNYNCKNNNNFEISKYFVGLTRALYSLSDNFEETQNVINCVLSQH